MLLFCMRQTCNGVLWNSSEDMGWAATKETLLNQPCNGFTPGLSTWQAPTTCWRRSVMLQYRLVPPVDDDDGSG